MTSQQNKGSGPNPASLFDFIRSGRLAWRLLRDPRVATMAKVAVPVLAGLYVLSPVDVLPDFLPVLGQLDDLAILALAVKLLIQLAPPAVVAEHRADMAGKPASGGGDGQAKKDVIDGDYRVIR